MWVCVCVRLCKSRGISLALEREKVQIFDQVEKTSCHQNTRGLEEQDKKNAVKNKEEGKLREGFEAWPAAFLFSFVCVRDAVVCSRVIITSNSV